MRGIERGLLLILLIHLGCLARSLTPCSHGEDSNLLDSCRMLINKAGTMNSEQLVNVALNYNDQDFCELAKAIKDQILSELNNQSYSDPMSASVLSRNGSYFSTLRLLFKILKYDYI